MLRVDGLKLETALRYYDSEEKLSSVSTFIILSSKAALLLSSSKGTKLEKSSICYNLGLSYLQSFNLHETSLFRDLAIKSLKKAIRLESHTSAFWLALGNAFVSSNPQAAQHCFIKAIALESRDASIWVNLAALYLRYGDALLAKDAFTRAQSVAPQLSLSWLGNALTEQALGDPTKASNLFTHAFIVSNGRSSFAQLLYALSVIDKRIKSGSSPRDIETAQEFSVANFAMKSYLKCFPRDVKGLEVAFTVSERCQDYTSGVNIATRLCEILEKQYEITESNDVLCDFAKAKTRLARVYLGTGEYEKALESAELTIALLDDDENLDDEDKDLESIMSPDVLSSRIIMGLCHFFKDDFNAALDQFKLILASNDDTERLVTFVAQVLYAYGTQDTKQAAVDQLFNFLDQYGSSLMVVLTLGALSIIDNLTEFLPAIKEEMNGLSLKEISSDTFRNVPRLINEIDKRIQSSDEKIWQKSAILFPSDFTVWKQLSPQMALKVASLTETKLTAYDFAQSNLAIGNLRLIQRSLILFPSYKEAQRALDGCF
ncbi:uncharacterized protein PRCAT00002202001 [Priceomyces carsonii]|uniref:uncharacterized protein n=1 Tax=Priceomyces carsonii TaxID=28549 RepID=UPI002EDB2221|nr:unnamed protein product [Priceomyces carsonii]